MKQNKITVVIPVYNGEDTISLCLDALTNQEGVQLGKDYEILVVDDGSADKTNEIVTSYKEVDLITLERNQGRIVARKTGAEQASTSMLLFIDSRVIPEKDTIKKALAIENTPAMAGDIGSYVNKYASVFDTIFYLLRRRYYTHASFEGATEEETKIDKDNFNRSAKGTGVLLIEKQLFLDSIPQRTDKFTNDDTFLFKKVVYDLKKPLFKNPNLRVNYLQRYKLRSVIRWLYERGRRFADYYLRPGGKYFYHQIAAVLVAIISIIVFILYPPTIALFLIGYVVLTVYFSENIRDFLIFFFVFPFILIIFGAGLLRFWFDLIFKLRE